MMSGVQVPGCKYYIDMAWTFGVSSFKEKKGPAPEISYKTHDQIVLYIGGDPDNPEDLGGDVEINMSGQMLKFNTTSALFIPHGLRHGPRRVREYRHPFLTISIMSGAGSLKEVRDDAVLYPSKSQLEEEEFI